MQTLLKESPDRIRTRIADGDLPPLPVITHASQELPNAGTPVVIGTSKARLLLWGDGLHNDWSDWTLDINEPIVPNSIPMAQIAKYWDGKPTEYTLTLRQFWQQVPNSYTHILPDEHLKQTFSHTEGLSTTDSQSISAELGVSAEGLGAKISETFTHSVTTSSETTVKTEYDQDPPPNNVIRVWVLWQLIHELVALDAAGNPISTQRGNADIFRFFPPGEFGSRVSYPNVRQLFGSGIIIPQFKDFPAT